jgi:hypothetical protein
LDITSVDVASVEIQVTKIPNNIPFGSIFATQSGSEAPIVPYFLLLEDGFYLLQENGFKIQL